MSQSRLFAAWTSIGLLAALAASGCHAFRGDAITPLTRSPLSGPSIANSSLAPDNTATETTRVTPRSESFADNAEPVLDERPPAPLPLHPEWAFSPEIPPAVPTPMPFPIAAVEPRTSAEQAMEPAPAREPELPVTPQATLLKRLASLGADVKWNNEHEVISVGLAHTEVTDADLSDLSLLPQLKILSLRDTEISDAGLQSLMLASKLQLLIVSGTNITDAGLQQAWTLPELRFIALDDTAVTDAAFEHLAAIKTLEGVSVMRTQMTNSAIERFQANHPECRIVTEEVTEQPDPPAQDSAAVRPANRAFGELRHADETALNDHRYGQPQREFQQLLRDRLRDPELLLAMGEQMVAQKRYHEAASILFTALLYAPADAQIQYQLGLALAYSGQMDLALPHLERAVGTATAYHDLGVISVEQGEPFQAEAYFSRAIDADPALVESHRWLSMLRARQSRPTSAMPIQQLTEAQLLSLLNSTIATEPATGGTGITIIPASGSGSR